MKQGYLLPEFAETERELAEPVNVASVPQRSPFRYPGGKTWLVPYFRRWIKSVGVKPEILIEPFAGGGIISLTAVFEDLSQRALMVELDEQIAAVWESVIQGEGEWLAKRIVEFDLTRENAMAELQTPRAEIREIAFKTILKNRTVHGGILAEGSSFLKYGENGKGIRSRWYPQTIARRIRNLGLVRDKLEFRRGDAFEVLAETAKCKNVVYFIDPPYTAGGKKAGSRLYTHFEVDHERLFKVCETLRGDFLMTYDNADEVRKMAARHGFKMKLVAMKNTHHAEMTELLIGRDLGWLAESPVIRETPTPYKAKRAPKPAEKRPTKKRSAK